MSFSPIKLIESQGIVTDPSSWVSNYKEQNIEHYHDTSQLTFIHPDDCLIVAGPPRLALASGSNDFHTIGFVSSIQYTETRSVQPLKAIGSRRHVFGISTAPVQVNMSRIMVVGRNLLNSFYANATFGDDIEDRNSKYDIKAKSEEGTWWTNLEEDVYRVPFGLGIIWDSAATLAGESDHHGAAEYIEVCTLVNRSQAIQSGQAVLMENVSMMADRIVPWTDYGSAPLANVPQILSNMTDMA